MKKILLIEYALMGILAAFILNSCEQKRKTPVLQKEITVNVEKQGLTIDGFGVNITPAQWNDGNLKPVLDQLVDDLGCTLFRFDNTGLANWMDPGKRLPDGTWPEAYLDSVYKSKVFVDAWATFRYLNGKGIEPFFNVSGNIHPGLGTPDAPQKLADFKGYADMISTMLKWAREKENLKFSLIAPFNETDIGNPEGPQIHGRDMLTATQSVIKSLNDNGLTDIKIVAMDDASIQFDKLEATLSDTSYVDQVHAFAVHTYGSDAGDGIERNFRNFVRMVKNSPFKNSRLWLTEYGDLDQTHEIEYEFAWRSTRRLMKLLQYGYSAGLAWDAFDNFHEHNQAWCLYGLLLTDTVNWKYTPKKRYFAARQIYRYVKPGWKMVEFTYPQDPDDVFKFWHDSFRHIRTLAFVSPEGNDYSIVIMNGIEADVELSIILNNIDNTALTKTINHFITGRTDNCSRKKSPSVGGNIIRVRLPEHTISTVTTLK
ncbi:MAG TPA: hypothetical protein DDW27_05420 [Bacteroidales bacterium]|nr:hypothetical protein [Bacteroidales bacterium]